MRVAFDATEGMNALAGLVSYPPAAQPEVSCMQLKASSSSKQGGVLLCAATPSPHLCACWAGVIPARSTTCGEKKHLKRHASFAVVD
jgi:hypothetical protein